MDYFAAFEISKSGLAAEKLRMDIVSLNIANSNSVSNSPTSTYKVMKVHTGAKIDHSSIDSFESYLANQHDLGVDVLSIEEVQDSVKKVYDPKNPYADVNGYIYRPSINPSSEMIEMINALRAYQANVKAISAAKAMAEEALRIGAR